MTEAGRSAEPPLMAPPGRDAERDGLIEDTVSPHGLMSAPPRQQGNGEEKQADVPFPADGIRGHSQDGDRDHGGERFSATAAALNGKLDSGRQVVRQAVAATNNWITNRAAKSDSSASSEDDADEPGEPGAKAPDAEASSGVAPGETVAAGAASSAGAVFGPAKSRPSFTPAASTEAASAKGPDKQAGIGAGRSLPQQSYPPSRSSAVRSSTSARPPVPNREPSAKWRREAARRSRRHAHLTLARVEPWSVMKFSGIVSIVAFIILFVAIAVLYAVLSGLGVFTSLQHTVSTVTSSQGSSGTNISDWFSASRILGWTAIVGALNIVLITAMSTIGAVIYNLIAHTVGGIEVTLRETE